MQGRAKTEEQKRAVIERLFTSWLVVPELRLGQMLAVVFATDVTQDNRYRFFDTIAYVEDEDLALEVERWTSTRT